jgi:hypothetical protein
LNLRPSGLQHSALTTTLPREDINLQSAIPDDDDDDDDDNNNNNDKYSLSHIGQTDANYTLSPTA